MSQYCLTFVNHHAYDCQTRFYIRVKIIKHLSLFTVCGWLSSEFYFFLKFTENFLCQNALQA